MKTFISNLLLFIFCLPMLGCENSTYFESVLEPLTKEAQFNCKLTYELDGKLVEIEDIILCEYGGYEVVGEAGKKRVWTSQLKSGKDNLVMLNFEEKNVTDALGNRMICLYFYFGTAEYYMGEDENQGARSAQEFNLVSYKYVMENGQIGDSVITSEEAYLKYKIKIIDWECDAPIKNAFR